MIMIFFFLIFGVIAVSYFKGKLFNCTNPMSDFAELKSKWDCLSAGGDWTNEIYNFDNSFNGLITLFVMSTTVGWADIMMRCIETTDIDYIPNEHAHKNPGWVLFFVLFIIVGAFFFLNLFVGVVISTFNSERDKIGGNDLLTEKQKEWIDLRLLVLRSSPLRKLIIPRGKFRQLFFYICNHRYFDKAILITICANTIVLFLKWYEQPEIIYVITDNLNIVFVVIFMTEAIIKMIAMGPKVYFLEGWNIFDFTIIFGSMLSLFIPSNTLSIRGAITIMRSFRILRLLRLIKLGKNLRLIFNTFVISLPSLANIGGLLLLFIFMYANIGMIIFGQVARNGVMNDSINFENFGNSFLTLFIVATGDSWSFFMASYAMEASPENQCIVNPSYRDYVNNGFKTVGCGNRYLAQSFFVSYMFVVNLVFLKIFIAIILQGYNDMQLQDTRLFNNDMDDRFREVWT